MVDNVRDWTHDVIRCSLDMVDVVSMVDLYVGIVRVCKGLDLDIISPCSALSHLC